MLDGEVEESEFQRGYSAGYRTGALGNVLELLHLDDWGKSANEWQRGFVLGYQDRVNKHQQEGEQNND